MLAFLIAFKDVVPWVALLLSVAALGVSILNYRRDRSKLQATSSYSQGWEQSDATIYVNIVNVGRRPIIIETLVYAESKRSRFGTRKTWNSVGKYFNHPDGLTLGESQHQRLQVRIEDLFQNGVDDLIEVNDMWILDNQRRRHSIKGIRHNIARLRGWDKRESLLRKKSK